MPGSALRRPAPFPACREARRICGKRGLARRDWLGTLDALQESAAAHPDDVVAGIYASRVIGFVLEPPPDDWEGIVHFNQK